MGYYIEYYQRAQLPGATCTHTLNTALGEARTGRFERGHGRPFRIHARGRPAGGDEQADERDEQCIDPPRICDASLQAARSAQPA